MLNFEGVPTALKIKLIKADNYSIQPDRFPSILRKKHVPILKVLLMVQKSQGNDLICIKPVVNNGRNYQPQQLKPPDFFFNHQQHHLRECSRKTPVNSVIAQIPTWCCKRFHNESVPTPANVHQDGMCDNLQNSGMDRGRDWSWRFVKIVDYQQHGWDIKYLFLKSSLGVCVSDNLCTVCSCNWFFILFCCGKIRFISKREGRKT